ncbi:hypothetical protein C4J81_18090 [Deltaproteobacteria bacterium Smac51]|nr:hypothetical protein C4J81_18090 [Deltaproteobacteria bacterium Smac51]
MTTFVAPKISVIVPVYNAAPYLSKCLSGLLAQTLRELEIIVIDDGSNDGSAAIMDDWAMKDRRIRVLHQENAGPGAARAKGFEIACAPYLTCVDADDWLDEGTYEAAWKEMADSDVDVVCWKLARPSLDNQGRIVSLRDISGFDGHAGKYPMSTDIAGLCSGSMCNKLYKKSILNGCGVKAPEGLIMGEDWAFWWKYVLHARFVFFLNDYSYYYRKRADSITHDRVAAEIGNRYAYDFLAAFEDVYSHYVSNGAVDRHLANLDFLFYAVLRRGAGYLACQDDAVFNGYALKLISKYELGRSGHEGLRDFMAGKPLHRLKYKGIERFFSIKNVGGMKVLHILGHNFKLWKRKPRKI